MNITEEIRDAYLSGIGIEKWHSKKIKANNFNWFLTIVLILCIFVGYIHIQNERNITQVKELKQKDSIIEYQRSQLDTMQTLVNSAVYFKSNKIN